MMTRVLFAIQFACLCCLLIAYSLAIAEPSMLRQLYESTRGLAGDPAWLELLEIRSVAFPQAAAHSAVTAVCLVVAYGCGLLRISTTDLHRRVGWDPQDVRTLAEALRLEAFSRALVPLLTSYVLVNNWKLFAPVVLAAPTKRTASVPMAWLAFITSRPALSIAALELSIAFGLLVGLDGEAGRRSVSGLRYFTSNTLAIFMACGLGFKLLLAAISLFRYRREEQAIQNLLG